MFRRTDRRSPDESAKDLPADEVNPELDDEIEAGSEEDAEELAEPERMDADLQSQAADYMADNDIWLYGPNATAVLELLDRLEEVGPDDASVIADAGKARPRPIATQRAKPPAASRAGRGDSPQRAHGARGNRRLAGRRGRVSRVRQGGPGLGAHLLTVGDAALDAATAIILEDELDELSYEALFLPWTDAIEKIGSRRHSTRSRATWMRKPRPARQTKRSKGSSAQTPTPLSTSSIAFGFSPPNR